MIEGVHGRFLSSWGRALRPARLMTGLAVPGLRRAEDDASVQRGQAVELHVEALAVLVREGDADAGPLESFALACRRGRGRRCARLRVVSCCFPIFVFQTCVFSFCFEAATIAAFPGMRQNPASRPWTLPSGKAEGSRLENRKINSCESGLFCLPRAATGLARPTERPPGAGGQMGEKERDR